MVDTHTHLNFSVFNDDWREVVERSVASGIDAMIVVGTDIESSKKAVHMASQHSSLYASIGIHPHHARGILNQVERLDYIKQTLIELAHEPRVVAIGEIGLDNHFYKKTKYTITESNNEKERLNTLQKKLFILQLKIAQTLNLPVILHSREAGEEVLELILKQQAEAKKKISGVFHCFEGSKIYLQKILEANFFVSFTGNITYSEDRFEISGSVPLDRLLLETDSPLLTPKPYRGTRNEPQHVKIIAESQAKSHAVQLSKVVKLTTKNARSLFSL